MPAPHVLLVLLPALSGTPLADPVTPPAPRTGREQEGSPQPRAEGAAEDGGWRFLVAPYLWMYGLEGQVAVRGVTGDFDLSFGDLLEDLDFAGMVHAEAWRGALGLYADVSYGKTTSQGRSAVVPTELETGVLLFEAGGVARVLDHATEDRLHGTADLVLGMRYASFDLDLKPQGFPTVSHTRDFVDLVVGGRLEADVRERYGLGVYGDVGGFDIGSSSELSWSLFTAGWWRLGPGRLALGYRWLDIDHGSSGSSGFDVRFSGPVIGYALAF